ncbi:nucleotidyltransferase family protein [Clostridium sp. 'White wine YQ']|uniref:nucleotidyltransferase family protein n=1 Tax=Clostridium sp. 'White wine YQ' TaxID=3027474 RepID=UPI002366C8B8|nr:nucleotidyltransferase family protein [Clostridium sp. 'White wine YQ']MDD7794614.1 nucleotidyltransferase family protein [Clostridium sp. 'White wine YQ']
MVLQEFLVEKGSTIKNAMKQIDKNAKGLVFVVEDNKLLGTLTDGDIRRWILKDKSVEDNVEKAMNKKPKYILNDKMYKAKEMLKKLNIEALPIIDQDKNVLEIIFDDDKVYNSKINIPVVIMAGGKGTRLYPYTKILPKPLIPIGETPIIERIINKFNFFGCDDFYLTLNYKKNMIKTYFNDLERNYKVNYVDEDRPLGTGGSLYLLKNTLDKTFFVSNCDIILDENYDKILKFHKEHKFMITVVASLKHIIIPYGVMQLGKDGTLDNTVEKPELSYLINTGIYILEPEVFKYIPDDTCIDLPTVIEICKNDGNKVGVYPVSENSWMDMGQIEEMDEMIKRLGEE